MRLSIAMGATIGVGIPLFRELGENLGPMVGPLVFLPAIAVIALIFSFLLGAFATTKSDAAA